MSACADRSGPGACRGVREARAKRLCPAPGSSRPARFILRAPRGPCPRRMPAARCHPEGPARVLPAPNAGGPVVILRGPARHLTAPDAGGPEGSLPDGARAPRRRRRTAGRIPERGRRRGTGQKILRSAPKSVRGQDHAAPPSGNQVGSGGLRVSAVHLPREAGEVASYRAGGGPPRAAESPPSCTIRSSPLSVRNERGGAGGGAGCCRRDVRFSEMKFRRCRRDVRFSEMKFRRRRRAHTAVPTDRNPSVFTQSKSRHNQEDRC